MVIEPPRNHTWNRARLLPELVALVVGLLVGGLAAGCGEAELPPGLVKKKVAFDKVPATPYKAARTAFPRVDFNEAYENLDPQGKLHSYEIRGRQPADGKIREVRVSATGDILESE